MWFIISYIVSNLVYVGDGFFYNNIMLLDGIGVFLYVRFLINCNEKRFRLINYGIIV